MKKVLLVFGTRPEAIKMAPVYKDLKRSQTVQVKVAVTGQHREMLVIKSFFKLGLILMMKPGQGLTEITAAVLWS